MALILSACNAGPRVAIVAPDGIRRATVTVEIADTEAKRELGLMYRDHLAHSHGMIFVFPRCGPVKFWMRDTKIPLDMIFADASGRVTAIVAHAQPYSDKLLGPASATAYVLEVNAGFAARNRIRPGDHFEFLDFVARAIN
jgi:uncharacterized membrane protein (UPF0127 family)